ncbi:MAG: hypothetical protein QOH50_131 [Kribbellaceae bacterium]|jgi:hypothetical protein|nr:hypothetical protein [Kribbellaceae bacterium]
MRLPRGGRTDRERRLSVRNGAALLGGGVAPVVIGGPEGLGVGASVIGPRVNLLGRDDTHQSVDRHAV